MQKEISATTKLWREAIESGIQDMGDGIGNALASFSRSKEAKPTNDQLNAFETALGILMQREIIESDNWNVDNPKWGCACSGRCLYTDYGADKLLSEAAEIAGFSKDLIPIKSSTHMGPGFVEYSFGYSAKRQTLIVE